MPAMAIQETSSEKIPFRIHMLRAANPLILKLLGSRIHFLLSKGLLVAYYRGWKSGRQFMTPLSYVEVGDRLYLCTRPTVAKWWRNMRDRASIEIVWRGRSIDAKATLLDSSSDEALVGFRHFLRENPGTASLLYHVQVGPGGELPDDVVRREIVESIIVRLEPARRSESSA